MTTLYLTENRSVVKKEGETLLVDIPATEQGGERRKRRVPLLQVEQVVVYGESTITTPALLALLEQGADVCFCNVRGDFRGRLAPELSRNGGLRLRQHAVHAHYFASLSLARSFVRAKLLNQRTLLLRSNRKLNDTLVAEAAERVRVAADEAAAVDGAGWEMPSLPANTWPAPRLHEQNGTPLGTLLGHEGAGSAAYFGVFARLLRQDLGFAGRVKRPPTDPVNALLSYGYALLLAKVSGAIGLVGLDPYIGFLHSTQYGKPALALDLMEEMRPVIVDSVVLTLLNNSILSESDFVTELGACRLTDQGRRTFLEKFEERLGTEIQHPVFGYKATYRKCLELQVRLLAKTLAGEIPAYPPFVVR